eukprot:CAMPEP_0174368030 /NCGR_PEP_ID=MMETSP0811_2-20130205/87548_1 /TAXON_ID=73025 ORGANISM="Eutreptiella gymnastica-like, Strain CCMP1594" /NCGR_SAMPLE_ID=MMETSP0811_2 /ASSEMBLY_ACC=CAM_ASM_000667 /LENGTH=113 /DNA_ID=CAMNT_0015511161 /DNA_START=410 /DNA_END=751 /DNA_ORIENTATION=-
MPTATAVAIMQNTPIIMRTGAENGSKVAEGTNSGSVTNGGLTGSLGKRRKGSGFVFVRLPVYLLPRAITSIFQTSLKYLYGLYDSPPKTYILPSSERTMEWKCRLLGTEVFGE